MTTTWIIVILCFALVLFYFYTQGREDKYKESYGLYNDLLEEGRQLNAELAKRTFQNSENIRALEELVNK